MSEEITKNKNWSSPKYWLAAFGLVLLAGVLVVAILRDRIVNQPQWQVSINGQGRVSFEPDIAKITLGVQIDKAVKAEDAINQLNSVVAKVVAAIESQSVPKENIQTQNLSLLPQYNYFENISNLDGYNANQQIVVTLKDINDNKDRIGEVINAATKAGANQVQNLAFDSSRMDDLKAQARLEAIADARKKANDISQVAGVRLGKIVGWWENYISQPYYDYAMGGYGGGGGAPVVPTGQNEVVIEINLNYQVK